MKTIYLDADFRCHVAPGNGLTPVETAVFDDKCDAYIEGYRFVPGGKTWIREDGVEFTGEMIAPWKPWGELDAAQREYEREQYQDLTTQNAELLDAMASMVDDVYAQDVSEIEGTV
jgi:hypothetical protein|nr:MAG TPA: hypothetical protein [Caudoviricetes sp.]